LKSCFRTSLPRLSGASEARLSHKQYSKSEGAWVPLKRAVFSFAICDEQLSLMEAEIAASSPLSFSLNQLTRVLKDKSCAIHAEIDTLTSTFSFLVPVFPEGSTRSIKGTPWELLQNIQEVDLIEKPGPPSHGSVTLYSPGFRENAKQLNMVRTAIDAVWSKLMLGAFNRAISGGTVALYARPHITSELFRRLPEHVWPLLNVVDWDNGVAKALDHTTFWSIYAEGVTLIRSGELEAELIDARPGEAQPSSHLREAPRVAIHEAIVEAYDAVQAAGGKPPNILELPSVVLPLLQAKGYRTSVRLIRELGGSPEYSHRRLQRGRAR
jgi:hypothetical protein